jgi:hypothetical protein
MNPAPWIAQGFLALAFTLVAAFELFAYEKLEAYAAKRGSTGITRRTAFIAIAELTGAIGVVLPISINVARALGSRSAWASRGSC